MTWVQAGGNMIGHHNLQEQIFPKMTLKPKKKSRCLRTDTKYASEPNPWKNSILDAGY